MAEFGVASDALFRRRPTCRRGALLQTRAAPAEHRTIRTRFGKATLRGAEVWHRSAPMLRRPHDG